MRELNYQLKQLYRNNRDGSYLTQAGRERQLTLIANQLDALGLRYMNAQSLKPKHVEALVKHWREEGISTRAIKNRKGKKCLTKRCSSFDQISYQTRRVVRLEGRIPELPGFQAALSRFTSLRTKNTELNDGGYQ